jgi:hypothetical protein
MLLTGHWPPSVSAIVGPPSVSTWSNVPSNVNGNDREL